MGWSNPRFTVKAMIVKVLTWQTFSGEKMNKKGCLVVEWRILTWCQVEAECSHLWHYRKTSPATVRKFLASLRLCKLLVNHHGDIGCWEVLGRETECIQRRRWQRSQSIKSLKVDSSSGAKEQRKIGSSCLVVTNAQFSKSPIVSGVWPRLPTTDVLGPESRDPGS